MQKLKVAVIGSKEKGVGKTTLAMNLAKELEQEGYLPLVVEVSKEKGDVGKYVKGKPYSLDWSHLKNKKGAKLTDYKANGEIAYIAGPMLPSENPKEIIGQLLEAYDLSIYSVLILDVADNLQEYIEEYQEGMLLYLVVAQQRQKKIKLAPTAIIQNKQINGLETYYLKYEYAGVPIYKIPLNVGLLNASNSDQWELKKQKVDISQIIKKERKRGVLTCLEQK